MAKKEYVEKNKTWLAEKAQEPGVKPLDGGVFYKVLKSGDKNGRTPDRGVS